MGLACWLASAGMAGITLITITITIYINIDLH